MWSNPLHPSSRSLKRWALGPIANWLRCGFSFLYPPRCPLCQSETFPAVGPSTPRLCDDCRREVTRLADHVCARCGAPVGPHLSTETGCIHCRRDGWVFDRIVRLGFYRGRLREACVAGKGASAESLVLALSNALWDEFQQPLTRLGATRVVSIPHHWTQTVWGRAFPETTLAQRLADCLHVPFSSNTLVKTRRTPDQGRLSGGARRANLRGAFRVKRIADVSGRVVLLVDDILTTGTTVNEAAKVLLRAGARRVHVVVLALAVSNLGRVPRK